MAVIPTPAALSPWPATTAVMTWKAAVARLRKELHPKSGATADPNCPDDLDQKVARLGMVASARVEQFAPSAPQAIRDEAVIRFAGYLASRPSPDPDGGGRQPPNGVRHGGTEPAVRVLRERGRCSHRSCDGAPWRRCRAREALAVQARAGEAAGDAAVYRCGGRGHPGAGDGSGACAAQRDRGRGGRRGVLQPRPGVGSGQGRRHRRARPGAFYCCP